jgi:hypothetical protein
MCIAYKQTVRATRRGLSVELADVCSNHSTLKD